VNHARRKHRMYYKKRHCGRRHDANVNLDRDCTTGFGPETITMFNMDKLASQYDVVVTQYSGDSTITAGHPKIEMLSAVSSPHQLWHFNLTHNGAENSQDYVTRTWEVFSMKKDGKPFTYDGMATGGHEIYSGLRRPLNTHVDELTCVA